MDKVFPLILRSIGIKKPCGRSGFSLGSTEYVERLHWLMKLAKNLTRISSLKKPSFSTIQPSLMWKKMPILTAIPSEPKKGLSREFLAYFATFLRDTAELALDELMDF